MTTATRTKIIGRVADHLTARRLEHPVRVAVDGITAAGKTTVAIELTEAVRDRGRPAIHLSMDDFHHPRARRHRLGRTSPDGYYRDAYDSTSFARSVLVPLGAGGDRRYLRRIHDLASDQPTEDPPQLAPEDAIVIVDGSFLQKSELTRHWDDVVFLTTSFDAALERGVRRDAALLGGAAGARDLYLSRYHAAAGRYLDECDPENAATVVIENDNPMTPALRRVGGPAGATVALFSYGTLQHEQVQRTSFGRTLDGEAAHLPGHRLGWATITDPAVVAASGSRRHPVVRPSGNPRDSVAGTVLTLTTTELAAADMYEVDDYRRAQVRLASGRLSWAYLAS